MVPGLKHGDGKIYSTHFYKQIVRFLRFSACTSRLRVPYRPQRDVQRRNLKMVMVVNRDGRMLFTALIDNAQTGRKNAVKNTVLFLLINSEVSFCS